MREHRVERAERERHLRGKIDPVRKSAPELLQVPRLASDDRAGKLGRGNRVPAHKLALRDVNAARGSRHGHVHRPGTGRRAERGRIHGRDPQVVGPHRRAVNSLAVHALQLGHATRVEYGGKENALVPRANRGVSENVGHVRGDETHHAGRDVLLAAHAARHQHGGHGVCFVLDILEVVDDLDDARGFDGGDDGPGAHVGHLAEPGVQRAKHLREGRSGRAADHLLGEDVEDVAVDPEPAAHGVRGGLKRVDVSLGNLAQRVVHAVNHGFGLERPIVSAVHGAAHHALPLLQTNDELIVTAGRQRQVLEREAGHLEDVHRSASRHGGEVRLDNLPHRRLEREIQVDDILEAAVVGASGPGPGPELAPSLQHGLHGVQGLAEVAEAACAVQQRSHAVGGNLGDRGHVDLLALARILVVAHDVLRRGVEVCAGVHSLEGAEVLLEVAGEAFVLVGLERGLATNLAIVTGHALLGDAVGVEVVPVNRDVAVGGDELDERLADGDVIGRGVVVEFLVPLLHHATHAVVVALNHENLVANALADVSVAAAANGGHDEAGHVAHRRVVLVQRRELRRALELGRGDFPGLDVVVVVPNQLPERHEPEPNRHRDEASLALALALRDEVGRDVEAMHERARRALLRVADVVDGPSRDVTGGARVAERALMHLDLVVVPVLALDHLGPGWHLDLLDGGGAEPPALELLRG
mmetsp:Transcript_8625/g.34871  ORF Transcript_8625/g.34871 Transcript_8625/m.34871 type:complete len:700 (-) Transcript_8625:1746-3845(-)